MVMHRLATAPPDQKFGCVKSVGVEVEVDVGIKPPYGGG